MGMKTIGLALVVLAGCGGSVESESAYECSMAETLNWKTAHVEYTATRGTCGIVPQELVARSEGLVTCDEPQAASMDGCSSRLEYECPTGDLAGTLVLALDFKQVAADRIELRTHLEIHHPMYPNSYCFTEDDGVMWLTAPEP